MLQKGPLTNKERSNQPTKFCLLPAYLLVLAEIISSSLKMEAISSSETSVATQQTTRRHIPEDDTLQQI
jgi:hypothetical protein